MSKRAFNEGDPIKWITESEEPNDPRPASYIVPEGWVILGTTEGNQTPVLAQEATQERYEPKRKFVPGDRVFKSLGDGRYDFRVVLDSTGLPEGRFLAGSYFPTDFPESEYELVQSCKFVKFDLVKIEDNFLVVDDPLPGDDGYFKVVGSEYLWPETHWELWGQASPLPTGGAKIK